LSKEGAELAHRAAGRKQAKAVKQGLIWWLEAVWPGKPISYAQGEIARIRHYNQMEECGTIKKAKI
jgi:hypothetical protein